jgi:hypothetical protein
MKLLSPKRNDPIAERERALSAELAAIQDQIRRLDDHYSRTLVEPRGETATAKASKGETVFESVDHVRVTAQDAPARSEGHYNELGIRKFDFAELWRRFREQLSGPAASNPKLINYLAAGSIQGLRPLRYERRVARNRVVALTLVLLFLLWGIFAVVVR